MYYYQTNIYLQHPLKAEWFVLKASSPSALDLFKVLFSEIGSIMIEAAPLFSS